MRAITPITPRPPWIGAGRSAAVSATGRPRKASAPRSSSGKAGRRPRARRGPTIRFAFPHRPGAIITPRGSCGEGAAEDAPAANIAGVAGRWPLGHPGDRAFHGVRKQEGRVALDGNDDPDTNGRVPDHDLAATDHLHAEAGAGLASWFAGGFSSVRMQRGRVTLDGDTDPRGPSHTPERTHFNDADPGVAARTIPALPPVLLLDEPAADKAPACAGAEPDLF